MTLQISDHVRALGVQAQKELTEEFSRIDAVAEENTARVLAAFQYHRVAEGYFAGTTGYGYDDLGRDKLDEISPTSLVRSLLWCGSSSSMVPMRSPALSSGR